MSFPFLHPLGHLVDQTLSFWFATTPTDFAASKFRPLFLEIIDGNSFRYMVYGKGNTLDVERLLELLKAYETYTDVRDSEPIGPEGSRDTPVAVSSGASLSCGTRVLRLFLVVRACCVCFVLCCGKDMPCLQREVEPHLLRCDRATWSLPVYMCVCIA